MNEIRKSVTFAAPIARVWLWLTDSEKLARWLMPNTFRPAVGARFTMDCPPGIGSGAPVACEVQELVPPADGRARLVYSWTIDRPLVESLLEIDLVAEGAMTRLNLVHSGWDQLDPADLHIRDRHDPGWDMLLGTVLRGCVEN